DRRARHRSRKLMTTPNKPRHEEYGEKRSPWSKPIVLLSGMFVLALLLGGIAFVIFNGGSSPSHHAQVSTPSSTGSAATRAASTAKPSPTGCTLPAGRKSVPSS